MKKAIITGVLLLGGLIGSAQNLELRSNKDLKQPGLVNPAMAGIQENLFRLLTNANLDNQSFMIEGRVPFNLGNYMIGYERLSNDDTRDNMFNITYGRNIKKSDNVKFRYGASVAFHTRSNVNTSFDSSSGYRFTDLNGKVTYFQSLQDLTGDVKYLNLDVGASLSYHGLLIAAGVNNVFNPDVSLIDGRDRRLPLQANATVGGFLDLGVVTFFPNAVVVYNPDQSYAKMGLDMHSKYVNLSAFYVSDQIQQDFGVTLASHYKKTFFGISYSQGLNTNQSIGDIRVFVNSSIFKSSNLFRSDFAQQIEKFY